MQKFSDVVLDKNGKPISGAVITVKTYPDGSPATIYEADGGGAVQSVTTDQNGRFSFYADNGHYSLHVSGTGVTPFDLDDITLFDPVSLTAPKAKGFWGDIGAGANIWRVRDRLFVGEAATNDGKLNNTTKDWLETERQYTTNNSNHAVLSTIGQTAMLGGSRSSDSLNAGSMGCIGGEFWSINDNTTQVQTSYAAYFESRRRAGAGTTHGIELDIVNQGDLKSVKPNAMIQTGITPGLWIASGGEVAGSSTASCAIGIINNGSSFERGIVFQQNALTSNEAMALGQDHMIAWYDTGGQVAMSISRTSIEMGANNAGIELGNRYTSNTPLLDFHSSGGNNDYDARIMGAGGNTTSSGKGEIQLYCQSLAFIGVTTATTAGAIQKYLIVKDEGVQYKLPLYAM